MYDALTRAEAVARITLIGAPRTILLDEGALGGPGTSARHQITALLELLGLDVVTLPLATSTLARPVVAIVSRSHPDLPDCYCWYVGAGEPPPGMQPTEGRLTASTICLLEFLGTGFAQERAGAAFRAVGAGADAPTSTPYDASTILSGISRRAAPHLQTPLAAPARPANLGLRINELVDASLAAVERCCAQSGAIAAAPKAGPGDPNYWFFWQRDAAHVAVALNSLAESDLAPQLRRRAATAVDGYLSFVGELSASVAGAPERASFSRCEISGGWLDGYGDPQPDGSAATALAVLTINRDPDGALATAAPFLDAIAAGACREPSFDLWELSVGASFYAVRLGLRALALAVRRNQQSDRPPPQEYLDEIARLHRYRRLFAELKAPTRSRPRTSQPGWFDHLSGLDASTVASELFASDRAQPATGVAATMSGLQRHYQGRWPVNLAWQATGQLGGGIGRFPADCNDGYGSTGGNPWPICTLWAARHHLKAAALMPTQAMGVTRASLGCGYLNFVLAHCDPSAISEQIDADTGEARGVSGLAWAHAEMIEALLMRRRTERVSVARPRPG